LPARLRRISAAARIFAARGDLAMPSSIDESMAVQLAIEGYIASLADAGITLRVKRNFETYAAIRIANGVMHLNQAFDPRHVRFGNDDFWLLALDRRGEAVATYCVRHFMVDDFYALIRSQALWFGSRPRSVDPYFVVDCAIPSLGGEVVHEGGCWVRRDYRGRSKHPRLSREISRLARAIALRNRPFDYDTGMILNDPRDRPEVTSRKAVSLGIEAYGFAGVHRLVDGWFPPEGRDATLYLCYSTRKDALTSLAKRRDAALRAFEFRQEPLVEQNEELIDALSVGAQWQ
jgi:hypothetical protein